MSDRFIVVNARPIEGGRRRDNAQPPHWKVRGYLILDILEDRRLPTSYSTRLEAQEECDRKNRSL